MNKDDKPQKVTADHEDLVETPLFMNLREWWRAKKESLDLWGFEKYLGCDNREFKGALTAYRNLLQEIDQTYKEIAKKHDVTIQELSEARDSREQSLLDAKRDFVYRMPENYRIWFKKTKVFHSWRYAPESWGFEEARYWGSRSGMTLQERRTMFSVFWVCIAILGLWLYKVVTTPTENPMDKATIAVFNIERDTTKNVDSLARVRILQEQKAEEQKRLIKFLTERNNRIINDVNAGVYFSYSNNMREEVEILMKLYSENVNRVSLKKVSNEALFVSLLLIGQNNPDAVVKKDAFGIPMEWKPNTKIKLSWNEIMAGLEAQKQLKP
jgi:hypothetical protein